MKPISPSTLHDSATHTGKVANDSIRSLSGASMDSAIKPRHNWTRSVGIAALALITLVCVVVLMTQTSNKQLRVDLDQLQMTTVVSGVFEDYVPINAKAHPSLVVMLDAVEGGRVEKIYVEDGQHLVKGQKIIDLSNTTLLMEVTRNEAMVEERLTEFRSNTLRFEQSRLNLKSQINDIHFDIASIERNLDQFKALKEKGFVSDEALDQKQIELNRALARRAILLEQQKSEQQLHTQQLSVSKIANKRMEDNLKVSRRNLENLTVTAPQDGKLSNFQIKLGQSVIRGQRIGQVNDMHYLLRAQVDEYYLDRVKLNQSAKLTINDTEYVAKVSKIYPTVESGKAKVDLHFEGEQPQKVRQGQSFRLKLILGDESDALLLARGAYMSDTGGHWVFVEKNGVAEKRDITLGRKNTRYIEVLNGLEKNDRVITSSYKNFLDTDTLILN